MNRFLALILALVCLCTGVYGEPEEGKPAVPAALAKATYLTKKKANQKAEYYIFLNSASWCGPCRMVMPKVVKEYRKMRSGKVELLLVSAEEDDAAREYMDHYKAKFPGINRTQAGKIPGVTFSLGGIPAMCLVDADGNKLHDGHGADTLKWKDLIKEDRAAKKKAAAERKRAEREDGS